MGAQLYFHTTEYTKDPTVALQKLQSIELENLDLVAMVSSNLESAQQAFEATPENDEYGLYDVYKTELERAKAIAAEEIPTDHSGRLNLVRRLNREGIGNILDVEGITGVDSSKWSAAKPLAPVELDAKFGSEKLLSAKVEEYACEANQWLERGECVFFPLYGDSGDHEAAEWCFVGNTVD